MIQQQVNYRWMDVFVIVAVTATKIKDDVIAGKRPATRLLLADVPDYVKEIVSQCWAQEPSDRPVFSGINQLINLSICKTAGCQ